jgi:hypothetical protein
LADQCPLRFCSLADRVEEIQEKKPVFLIEQIMPIIDLSGEKNV